MGEIFMADLSSLKKSGVTIEDIQDCLKNTIGWCWMSYKDELIDKFRIGNSQYNEINTNHKLFINDYIRDEDKWEKSRIKDVIVKIILDNDPNNESIYTYNHGLVGEQNVFNFIGNEPLLKYKTKNIAK